jgi:hypothetical protein
MLKLIINDDNPSSPEKKINKKLDNKRKLNNIDAKKCACDDCKGEIIGRGRFSTIYEHKKYPNLVIKDSKIYNTISKCKHMENIEQKIDFLEEHNIELLKIQIFSDFVLNFYSSNFIKYYELDHDCATNNSERNLNNSDDSNDDEYLINQMVLEKVNGKCINNYEYSIDEIELIFKQLFYIIINLNLKGCFHNDIKVDNIMIEKRKDISVLKLEPVNNEKTGMQEIILEKKGKYFPLVKFVDYSLSYINNDYELFVPIETINVSLILKKILINNNLVTDQFNSMDELCEKIKREIFFLSISRINDKNVKDFNNLSEELFDNIKNIFN